MELAVAVRRTALRAGVLNLLELLHLLQERRELGCRCLVSEHRQCVIAQLGDSGETRKSSSEDGRIGTVSVASRGSKWQSWTRKRSNKTWEGPQVPKLVLS
jgi:hypothetical protein